jgi:NAD(P)-dependent dehydrogenase (short-subunit alcohol dehydrogenase family)
MNIAIKPENMTSGGALAGKVSLVTGSTSGIGLGIARALAAAGSEIVLNGFGKPERSPMCRRRSQPNSRSVYPTHRRICRNQQRSAR